MSSWFCSLIVRTLLFFLPLAVFCRTVFAADVDSPTTGVKDTEILIGQCAALSGPSEGLGKGMNIGMKAAFEEVNAKGGINGRNVRLIASDDGYDPEKSVECTEKMVEENSVFALAGYVGTPTAKVAAPVAQEYKVPLVGLFTGASLLREPVQRYIVNIRASYDDETEALVAALTNNSPSAKIAVFYQNDSFGLSVLSGVEKALGKRKMALAAKGSFERNTLAVQTGLAAIINSQPETIIVVAPYKPTAIFVKAARDAGLKSSFATISFVGTENLIEELGAAADGFLISQVVPSPADLSLAVAGDYRKALGALGSGFSPSYVSFEGYVTARVLIAALEKAGRDLTREKLIDTIEAMSKADIGGISISFSATNHQGSNDVFLTTVKGGKAVPLR